MAQPIRLHSTWGVLSVLIFSSLVAGLGFSMGTLLVNEVLKHQGYNEFIIGVHTGLASLATAMAAPFVPSLARRFGYVWPVILASFAMAALYAILPSFHSLMLLFLGRFLFGLLLSVPWVLLEAWVNQVSPAKHRGKITSAYGAFLMLGYGLGSVLLSFVGSQGALPFYLLAGLIAAASLPLLLLVSHDPVDTSTNEHIVSLTTVRQAPFLFATGFLGGFLMVGYFGLTGVYAHSMGFSVRDGNDLLGLVIIGGLVLQLPIGWMADKLGARFMIYLSLAFAGLLSLTLPHLNYLSWQVGIVIVYAALLQSLFTLSLALLCDRFPAHSLAAANAVFVVAFEVGSVTGPPLLGGGMQLIHPNMLPYSASVLMLGLLALQGLRLWRHRPRT